MRRLFDPEFIHPSPDDVKPTVDPKDKPLPWQIRAYVAPLPTRTYQRLTDPSINMNEQTITYVDIDTAPFTLLATRAGYDSARRFVERFDFDGTPYAAIAAFRHTGFGIGATNLGQPVYGRYWRRLRDEQLSE